MRFNHLLPGLALLSAVTQAHPGHDISELVAERAAHFATNAPRDISHCAAKLKARGHQQRTIDRRSALLKREREKRGIMASEGHLKARALDAPLEIRDAASALNTTHLSPTTYTPDTDVNTLFASNSSCVLVPEVTEGPYYVSGELIRSDVRDNQTGLDLILDIQVIDTATCEPVSGVYIDFWHCNSTGVYSGVVASGNGNIGDTTNLNETHHRGLQETSSDGVAQFTTTYPGHYTGRTNHIHVATHTNGTVLANNTYSSGTVSHVGQLFMDQNLTSQVEATGVYATNTQTLTTNAEDSIFSQEAASGDPVVEYSLLSDDINDGVFAWIAFGIDASASKSITAAAVYGENGGTATGNSGGGGAPPGDAPSGTPPSK
ncbi:extracellular dioxygenase-2 [Coleophoma cylindrospora]|uniref:Extracellular dioxygenase-2 n=1 Tax=Coleophoma cylindrospora TaxID=1849047 RepID=A0A3D8RMH5_9HELO|nr:extracellular dioxygenase-2 [Coleophoma cylindrospora]